MNFIFLFHYNTKSEIVKTNAERIGREIRSFVFRSAKNILEQMNISAKKQTKAEKANLKFGTIDHVSAETLLAISPIKFISKFENQNKFPKKLLMKTRGTAIRLTVKATVKIGIIIMFKKIEKNETPLNVEIKTGKIKNCAEIVVARGFARKFGRTNFLIGFLRKE